MSPIAISFLAFVVTAAVIVVLRPIALRVGLVDVPNARKSHTGQVPLIGGVSIFMSLILLFSGQLILANPSSTIANPSVSFLLATLILIVVGVWDDLKDLSAYARFGAQIVAALIMIFGGGVMLVDLGELNLLGGTLYLSYMSVPFTVFATLGIINAINMCDGLDGLSGSLSFTSLLGLGAANLLWGSYDPFFCVMAASIAGFLFFNMRTFWRDKAWVFLGDAGSMMIGLTLCWLAISMSQGELRVISPAAALWFLMVPLFDAVSMMVRRIQRKRSPFTADKEHLHHVFLLAGFSVSETVAIMTGFALSGVLVGLGGMYLGISDAVMATAFVAAGVLYFWAIMRAWRVLTFLRRSICRREKAKHQYSERRQNSDPSYSVPERRGCVDRRKADVAAYTSSRKS
jgi:UDP-GlcNAc:undecaprenyl-phosphate/decaprenyl-phosphate GlcNAc-1-phosphate transferase